MMGRLTLANFETEIEKVLGNRSIGSTRLDYWLNMARDELVGSIDFPVNLAFQIITTVKGTPSYTIDSNLMGISGAYDITNQNTLTYNAPRNWVTLDDTTEGDVKLITHFGGKIYLWPTPYAVATVKVLKRISMTEWDTGASGLPDQYDPAIEALALSYAFASLEEFPQSTWWWKKASAIINARRTPDELDDAQSVPIRVISSWADLREFHSTDFTQ